MATGFAFVPNPDFERELENETDDEVLIRATIVKKIAESIAPEDEGDYKDSFEIILWQGATTLSNTDFKAHWIEWGAHHEPPEQRAGSPHFHTRAKAVLRRAVLLAGLRFKATPKKK